MGENVEPADSALLEYVADGFASGDYQGDNEHAREIAARLRARAAIIKREEDRDHALTEVEHGDMGVVARFRRVSEARKHVREVMDGVTFDRDVATYHWQLGPVHTNAPMSGDSVRISIRHPLPAP